MTDRKLFQHLPAEENPHFFDDGLKIYNDLKQKYPDLTVEHLDNILNALCAALTILACKNMDKDNHKYFLQLVHKAISRNL